MLKKIPLLRLYFPSQKLCSLNFSFYFLNFNIFTNNIISDEDAKVMQYTTWIFVFQMVLHFQKYSNHFNVSLQYFKLQIWLQMNHESEKIQASFYTACYLIQNDVNILQFSWISFLKSFDWKPQTNGSCNVETHVLIDSLKNHIWRNFPGVIVIGGNLISMNILLEKEVGSYTYK
jgi:hypothetical protein